MGNINIEFICLDLNQHIRNDYRVDVSWVSSVSPTVFESIAKDLIRDFAYNGKLYTKIARPILEFGITKDGQQTYDVICYVARSPRGENSL